MRNPGWIWRTDDKVDGPPLARANSPGNSSRTRCERRGCAVNQAASSRFQAAAAIPWTIATTPVRRGDYAVRAISARLRWALLLMPRPPSSGGRFPATVGQARQALNAWVTAVVAGKAFQRTRAGAACQFLTVHFAAVRRSTSWRRSRRRRAGWRSALPDRSPR